jgi:hypothetical protein
VVVEVSAEVGVGTVAGEDVPDDHYPGVGEGDDCFFLGCGVAVAAEAARETVIARPQAPVGAHC